MVETKLKLIGTRSIGKKTPFLKSMYVYYLLEDVFYDSIDDFNMKLKRIVFPPTKHLKEMMFYEAMEIGEPCKLQVDEGLKEIGVGTLVALKITISEVVSMNFDSESLLDEVGDMTFPDFD